MRVCALRLNNQQELYRRRLGQTIVHRTKKVMTKSSKVITTTTTANNNNNNNNNKLTQYIVIRKDLWREQKWPLGSICAQVAHASVAALQKFNDTEQTKLYLQDLTEMRKVVLEVKSDTQLIKLYEKLIGDKIDVYLWREQPEDIVTCLALRPYVKEDVAKYFKKCNLASDLYETNSDDKNDVISE